MRFSIMTLASAFVIALALYFGALKNISISGKRKRGLMLMLAVILTIAGSVLAIIQGPEISRELEIHAWPSVAGQVTATAVTGERASMPQVSYTYTVNDSTYDSRTDLNMPGFGGRGFRKQTARRALIKYPTGSEIVVYYDPDNPSLSTLRRGFRWAPLARMSFGGILFAFGIALSIVRFRRV
ncbi:MAG: DUF3592 domain-containing protein [candidate division Zixibacteria bacterium]|nr:DUF3592 domain-containing protein [candidate division Zixibacteria bacterium]